MNETLKYAVDLLLLRQDLTVADACQCIGAIMDGQCDPVDIASFLTARACKGAVADEVVGAARAM